MSDNRIETAKHNSFSSCRARTPEELAELFMNPNSPKSEAEHWAVREIEKLRAEVERLRFVLRDTAENLESSDPTATQAAGGHHPQSSGGRTMGDDMPPLLPCPFCGNAPTMTETWTHPTMNGKQSLIGVYVRHWCDIPERRPAQRSRIEVHGRDHADVVAVWNHRAKENER